METIKSLKMKIEELESQNKVLLNMYENVRDFKHDYGNFIQILDGYSKINSMDGVKKLCNREKLKYNNVNCLGIIESKIINVPCLYNVLVNYFFVAKKLDVKVDIEALLDFQKVIDKISDDDFLQVFDEFLRSAIETAKFSEKKKVNITFSFDIVQNCVYVIIENTYNESLFKCDRICKKVYNIMCNKDTESVSGCYKVDNILKHSENVEAYTSIGDMLIHEIKVK